MTDEKREIRALADCELELRDNGDGLPTIRGYAAVFNKPSLDLGGFVETIARGAFTRTLAEGADVRALVEHDSSRIIGRSKAGTLTMEENQRGLKVAITPADTTAGRDIVESVRRGDVDGMSFAFQVNGRGGETWAFDDDGPDQRTLVDVDLFDVSVVTFPAYPDTSVAVRSMEQAREAAEDTADLALIEARRGEEMVPWETVKAELGLTDVEVQRAKRYREIAAEFGVQFSKAVAAEEARKLVESPLWTDGAALAGELARAFAEKEDAIGIGVADDRTEQDRAALRRALAERDAEAKRRVDARVQRRIAEAKAAEATTE